MNRSSNPDKRIKCDTGEKVATYEEYLKTNHWHKVRAEAYKVHGKKCAKCGKTNRLNMHHLTYERIGHENILFDLIPLCREHHIEAHFTNPKAKHAIRLELTGSAKINALKVLNDKWVREEHEAGKKRKKWLDDEKGEVLRVIRNSHYNNVANNLRNMYGADKLAFDYMKKDKWYIEMMRRKRKSGGL